MSGNRSVASPFLMIFLAALVAGMSSWADKFSNLDNAYFDFLARRQSLAYPNDVVIIAIDEASIAKLGGWPWSRAVHAQLLEKLLPAEAVVFDVIFAERQANSTATTLSSAEDDDRALAAAMSMNANVVLPMFIEEQQFRGLKHEVLPHSIFAKEASALGHVEINPDGDGITRGVFLQQGLGTPYWPHLAKALSVFLKETTTANIVSSVEGFNPYLIQYADFYRLRYVGAPQSIFRFSYIDVLEGRVSSRQLVGKRVFIGATAKGLGDDIPTPLGLMSGVEFHANVYQSLRQNRMVENVEAITSISISVVVVLAVCYLLSHLSPLRFFVGSFLFGLIWLFTIGMFMHLRSLWFPPSAVLVSIALFYPIWSWRRIELALVFLREELHQLKSGLVKGKSIDLSQLKKHLQSLKLIELLDDFSVNQLKGGALWPDVALRDQCASTGFIVNTKRYEIVLKNPQLDQRMLFASLLGEIENTPDLSQSSYELVEQTINEIHLARRSANRLQRRMNRSMERLQDAVVVTDRAGKINFFNRRSKELFCDDLMDCPITDLQKYLDRYQWLSLLKKIMVDGLAIYQEIEGDDDQCLLCQAMMLGGADRDDETIIFVFTDVTTLRQLERSKNEALAFLSHDMRSPIVSQLSLIERFNMQESQNVDAFQVLVEQLATFSNMSLKYAENFLQLSRAEHLDHRDFRLVDMHGVVDSSYAQVGVLGAEKNIRINIDRSDEECWVLGDGYLLERAIMNLLANAIQYSAENSQILLKLSIEKEICVSVSDQGEGIDERALPHLFEPYFREAKERNRNDLSEHGDESVSNRVRGHNNYGLGLSFVNTVVKKHGGYIDVESLKGVGTKFTLRFNKTVVE